MASLSESGFSSIDLITDTGGPSSGAASARKLAQTGAAAARP
jgi:hypothetical protein